MASFISHPRDAQGNCKYVLFINEIKMKQFLFYTTSFWALIWWHMEPYYFVSFIPWFNLQSSLYLQNVCNQFGQFHCL